MDSSTQHPEPAGPPPRKRAHGLRVTILRACNAGRPRFLRSGKALRVWNVINSCLLRVMMVGEREAGEIRGDVAQLLAKWSDGDTEALQKLIPLIYGDLQQIAKSHLHSAGAAHTLQCTAVVHEAYLRLVGKNDAGWRRRAHFFGVSAQLMRRILAESARSRQGEQLGTTARVSFEDSVVTGKYGIDAAALDDALSRLASLDEQQARVVELRYFAGLSIEETAEVMRTSPATVKRDWVVAKAWLRREINRKE